MNRNSSALTERCSSGRSRNHQYQISAHTMPTAPNSTKGRRQPCHATSKKTIGVVTAGQRKLPTKALLRPGPGWEEGNKQELLQRRSGKRPPSPRPNENGTTS